MKKLILSSLLCVLSVCSLGYSLPAQAKYWDCEVKVYGPDFWGIRRGIFGGSGTLQSSAVIEVEANSRFEAELKALNEPLSYKGKNVCAVGGIDDDNCRYWLSESSVEWCSAQ